MGAINFRNGNVLTLAYNREYPTDEELQEFRKENDYGDDVTDDKILDLFLDDVCYFEKEAYEEIETRIDDLRTTADYGLIPNVIFRLRLSRAIMRAFVFASILKNAEVVGIS